MNDVSGHAPRNVASRSAKSARAAASLALLRLLAFAPLLAVTVAVGACDSEPLANTGTCIYQGETFAKGVSIPAGDGCNTCSCRADGQVACTLIGCVDAGSDGAPDDVVGDFTCTAEGCVGSCTYEGNVYPAGAAVPSNDGCNTCSCQQDGQVACTLRACGDASSDASSTCSYGGETYSSGATIPALDGCNTCTCTANGVACTEKACLDSGQPGSCTYAGTPYLVGATFPATDGCNTCSCSTAGVACTKVACLDGGVADGGATGVCTPGQDQTCNENPAISSLRGKCQPDRTCLCASGAPNPSTGRCPDVTTGCQISPGEFLPSGTSFPCADGCNTCTCVGSVVTMGNPLCGGPNACNLDEALYDYGFIGGLVAYRDHARLFPNSINGADYGMWRTYTSRGTEATTVVATCPVGLPQCGDPAAIDIGDIIADLGDPAVQAALLGTDPSPLLFGLDTRPVDSPIFSIKRGAREMLIGAPCNGASGCAEIPPALAKLENDLVALDRQQLASPRCAAIATGTFSCGSTKCQTGFEYCARATANGAEKVATCRPYPSSSCTTCDCVAQDALAVLGTVSSPSCAMASNYECYDDLGYKLWETYSSGALSIICAAP